MAHDVLDVKKLELIVNSLPPYPYSWHGMCFGCSRQNPHGLLMSFWPLEGGLFSKCQIPEYFCGFDGIAHGGVVASVLDEAMAWTINTSLTGMVLTRKMETSYLKPVPTKTDLFVVSRITHVDERSVTAAATIQNGTGITLAKANGEFPGHPSPRLPRSPTCQRQSSVNYSMKWSNPSKNTENALKWVNNVIVFRGGIPTSFLQD